MYGQARHGRPTRAPSPAAVQARRVAEERRPIQRVHFDRTRWGSVLLIDPKPTLSRFVDLFTAPENVEHVEITNLGLKGTPTGVWHNMISWALRVGDGGVQEFLPGSGRSANSAGTTPAPTDMDAGLRWAAFGSLHHPAPVSIRLGPRQILRLVVVDYLSVAANNNVPLCVHARIQGLHNYTVAAA